MKRLFLIPLIIVLLSSLVLSGCAQPASAPVPGSPPASAEPIKLRLSHGMPPMTVFHTDVYVPWAEMIKERTTAIGKPVEIAIFPAEALAKHPDQYNLLLGGGADIVGIWGPGQMPGRFPLGDVMELPLLFPSATVATQVAQELYETWPEYQEEMAEAKVLFFQPTAPTGINCRTKQIKTLEDLKGVKTQAIGMLMDNILKALGATPVTMMMPEIYVGLERGIVDIVMCPWELSYAVKFTEVTKYRTDTPRGVLLSNLLCSMNWDTWNSLPPDVQEIFEELSGPYMSNLAGEAMDRVNANSLELIKEYDKKVGNPEVYNIPEDEFQRWVEAVTPLYEKWVTDTEARGLPGRALFEDVQRLVEKYSK